MKDGDIFRWRYKQHVIDKNQDSINSGTLYWCCSQIAVYKNGKLRDTYWSSGCDGRRWEADQAKQDLNLEFLANGEDLEETIHPQYYDPEDVVDIRHANQSRNGLYIRKGAKRSKKIMTALIKSKIGRKTSDIEWAKRQVEQLKEKLVDILNIF